MSKSTAESLEVRVTELEIKLSFQSSTLETLSAVLTDQQREIETLREKVKLLHNQLSTLSSDDPGAEKPPHY